MAAKEEKPHQLRLPRPTDTRTFGQRVSDEMANFLGSWPFIIGQTVFVVAWIVLNVIAYIKHWDPYPFILLNLMFSIQAAYSAPIIMMSQNRQAERDRAEAENDFNVNRIAEIEVEKLLNQLTRMESVLMEQHRILTKTTLKVEETDTEVESVNASAETRGAEAGSESLGESDKPQ